MYDEMPEFHSAMGEEHGDISHVNACLLWRERGSQTSLTF